MIDTIVIHPRDKYQLKLYLGAFVGFIMMSVFWLAVTKIFALAACFTGIYAMVFGQQTDYHLSGSPRHHK